MRYTKKRMNEEIQFLILQKRAILRNTARRAKRCKIETDYPDYERD